MLRVLPRALRRIAAAATAGWVTGMPSASASAVRRSVSSSRDSDHGKSLRLASSLERPARPTLVLIHGLDSSKDTFSSVVADLQKDQYPAMALDLRGHGESSLGDESEFTLRQLCADIRSTVSAHGISRPFVLLGHSMGGMVVTRYAAEYPSDVAALIIEDMDMRVRPAPDPTEAKLSALRAFSREFPPGTEGFRAVRDSLMSFGYARSRVDSWRRSGRIFELPNGRWWTNVNPMAQYLARLRVLSTPGALHAFQTIADTKAPRDAKFPVHLLVAGPGTVCAEEGRGGLWELQDTMPELRIERFPNGSHSIHNTDSARFLSYVKGVVDEAARASDPRPS